MPTDPINPQDTSSAVPSSADPAACVGFYGKLPARGDFVQRNLPRSFIDPWDDWLQEALAGSREQLGEQWLRSYLTSPVWRFALCGGLCGEQAVAGVLIPSVDRVGRYFPLAITALLPDTVEPLVLAEQARSWYESVESLILQGLEDDLDFEQYATEVSQLAAPQLGESTVEAAANKQNWCCPVTDLTTLRQLRATLTPLLLRRAFGAYSVWWTQGSEHIAPCLLLCSGLPAVPGYAALLAGQWERWDWWVVPLATAATKTDDPLGEL
ncbi:MAG: type VI secretion system-associated protein TagF [Gammaproteobacteria bacterium]